MSTEKYISIRTKQRMNEALAVISGESLDHVPVHEVVTEVECESGNAYALYNALCHERTKDQGHVRCNVGIGVLEMTWTLNAGGRFKVRAAVL